MAAVSLVALALLAPAFADEPYAKPAHWLALGYRPVVDGAAGGPSIRDFGLRAPTRPESEVPPWAPHSLAWPIEFQDRAHSMGNTMGEFQSYGDGPYYHGGCDLRVAARAAVRTPVAGRVEAGHYGYSNRPDGSSEKYWTPWPGGGSTTYFEIAVITDDGYRFEFHHMDETRIAPAVLEILKAGKGRVEAGAVLGDTIAWPDGVYHHTHYNIHTPSGVQLNPEYYSPLIEDSSPPELSRVLASFKGGRTADVAEGAVLGETPEFFAVAAIDHQDGNVYDHPPSRVAVSFENGAAFAWDFTERLRGPDGAFPPIWDFFVESISGPDGKPLETSGGYGEGLSVVRLPVPAGAIGAFTIEVADEAGNAARVRGRVGSPLQ